MIAPTPFFADRGCHVRILEETQALQKRGHQVLICTYHHGRDVPGIETRRIPKIPWYQKLEAGPSWHKLYLDFLLLFESFLVALKFKPDIIHAHLHEGAVIGKILSFIFQKPLVFDYQGSLAAESADHGFIKKGSALYNLFNWLEGVINLWADVIVTSAPQNFATKKTILLYDGIDTEQYRLLENGSKAKRTVVYLGLLGPHQGTDLLVRALPKVLESFPDARFLIGGYPGVEEHRSLAKELGVGGRADFPGRVDYKKGSDFLNRGTIAVAPKISQTEANQKILTYMACGLPVVAFDTPTNRAMLGDLGVYAKLGDVNSLASGLVRLLSDDGLVQDLGQKVREKAVREFSWDRGGEILEGIYDGLKKTRS